MNRFGQVALIGAFDFVDSIRSRKAIALLVLFFAASLGSTYLFIKLLNAIEQSLAKALAVASTERPGAMTASLFESEQFRDVMGRLVGDRELAGVIMAIPPLALFYGALVLALVPVLVVLSSSDAIAQDVASGSIRYSLLRVDRLSFVLGKLLGQFSLLCAGMLVGAVASYVMGAILLAHFEPVLTGYWMLRLGGRALLYGFAYLGIALGVSQLTRSAGLARALGITVWIGLAILGAVLDSRVVVAAAPSLAPALRQILPSAHRLDLFRPDLLERAPAYVMLLALGFMYFGLAHLRFARRDA
jgi:ABC-type transport system involved in multi-copper enzyme maturation permease subunit